MTTPSLAQDHIVEAPHVEVTPEMEAEAEKIIAKYPDGRRSASMPLLYLWQETFGFISNQGIHWVAEKAQVRPVNILEIVTFYPMFRQHAFGKFHITVCRTLSCALAGSYDLRDKLAEKCGIRELDEEGFGISPDGKYSIAFIECLAACGFAPIVQVNDDYFDKKDLDGDGKIDAVLAKYTS